MKDIDLIVNTHPEPRHKACPCACGRLGGLINQRLRSFYPTIDALTINPNEPLDP